MTALAVALAVVALAALGFGAAAVGLAIRAGKLDGDNRVLIADRNRLRVTVAEASVEITRSRREAEQLESDHAADRKRIYDQIREKYGDAAVGDLAVRDLERLLSPPEGDADDDSHG